MQASEYFRTHTPSKPYCTNDLEHGLCIRSLEVALKQRYLQINHRAACSWLVFDVDREGAAYAAQDAGLPEPSAVIITPHNRHAHVWYALDSPVFTSHAAKLKPIEWLAAIQRTMGRRMGADMGYCGLITKNLLDDYWIKLYATDAPIRTYTLQQLHEDIGLLDPKQKTAETTGYGRNATLFDGLRRWAYTAIRRHRSGLRRDNFVNWQAECFAKAVQLNAEFYNPLSLSEIRSIAKSTAKWCWKKDPEAESAFLARQSHKGKESGKVRQAQNEDKRVSARLMHATGMSTRQIGDELGVSHMTVSRWLKL